MARTIQTTLAGGLAAMIHLPTWQSKDAQGLRAIIACHGHGGQDIQIAQGEAFAGHPEYLADHGYVVGCVSTGDTWLNPAAMANLTTLYNYLVTTLGADGPKVGMLGWSMGGGMCLRWIAENPTLVAAAFLCSPMTDLDAFHADATYTAEIDAAYAATGGYTTGGSPRSPRNTAAAFRGGPKILIANATNDPTVTYASTQAFLAAVNDPGVTLRQPDVTGGHQGGLTQVPPRESWEFLRTHWTP